MDDQELSPLRSDNISGNFIFILAFVAAPTLVRTKSFHLLSQTARLLESPTGAFIASQPQGRSKRIFHEKGRNGKRHLLALAPCGGTNPLRRFAPALPKGEPFALSVKPFGFASSPKGRGGCDQREQTERAHPLPCGELPPQRLRGLQIGEARKMLLAKRLAFFRFDLCFGIIKGE